MSDSGEMLFVRNQQSGSDDDVWDDEELIEVYDKALHIARSEVAKRLAMDTNSKKGEKVPQPNCSKQKKKSNNRKKSGEQSEENNVDVHWKEGAHCRSIYTEDEMEYEAVIKLMMEEDYCIVKYIGYDNEEIVPLNVLKPSWGKYAIIKQTEEATRLKQMVYSENDFLDETYNGGDPQNFTAANASGKGMSDNMSDGARAVPLKKKAIPRGLVPQPLPFTFPPFMPSLGTDHMIPPPPMSFLNMSGNSETADEEKALHTMLASWYMTGYYTGLYQGKKSALKSAMKEERNK